MRLVDLAVAPFTHWYGVAPQSTTTRITAEDEIAGGDPVRSEQVVDGRLVVRS